MQDNRFMGGGSFLNRADHNRDRRTSLIGVRHLKFSLKGV